MPRTAPLRSWVEHLPVFTKSSNRTLAAGLATAVLISTVGVGIGAVGSDIWPLQSVVLSLGYVVWALLIFLTVVLYLLRSFAGKAGFALYLSIAGSLAVLVGLTSLWFAQQLHSNEMLTWNVDYRLHLMHTNSIILTGGLDSVLLLHGQPSGYHAGPAWVVAALNTVLGFDINFSSFFLIPVVSYLSLVAGTVSLGRRFSINSSSVVLGSAFASLTPFLITGALAWAIVSNDFSHYHSLRADSWQFGPGLMINTQLGLGCFGIGLWAVSGKKFGPTYLMGSLIFAGVFLVKPQIALAALAVFPALIASRFVGRRRSANRENAALLGLIVSSAVAGLLFLSRPPSFSDTTMKLVVVEPGFGNFAKFGPVSLMVLLSCLLLLLHVLKRRNRSKLESPHSAAIFIGALAGIVLLTLVGTIFLRVFLYDGSPPSRDLTSDLLQGFWYLTWLCLALLVALLLDARHQKLVASLLLFYISIFVIVYLFRVASDLLNPLAAYEAYDASEVLTVLEAASSEEARVLTTDFAEPAEDFRRSGDANYLTLSGVPIFLGGMQGPDVAQSFEARRRAELQSAFLETDWQPWHEMFLEKERITHVLISQRCVPKWGQEMPESLVEISRSDNWSLFKVVGAEISDFSQDETALYSVSRQEITPTYGLAGCSG